MIGSQCHYIYNTILMSHYFFTIFHPVVAHTIHNFDLFFSNKCKNMIAIMQYLKRFIAFNLPSFLLYQFTFILFG